MTENGRIFVSGMEASNYVSFLDIQPSLQAWLYHSLLFPVRLACRFNVKGCAGETYTNGISDKYKPFVGASLYLGALSRLSQWMLVLAVTPLACLGWLLDWLVLRTTGMFAFAASCVILGYYRFSSSKSKLL